MSGSGSDLADFAASVEAYRKQRAKLLEEYPGWFVAFYQGELVGVNSDEAELIKQVRAKKGNIRAFIQKITPKDYSRNAACQIANLPALAEYAASIVGYHPLGHEKSLTLFVFK